MAMMGGLLNQKETPNPATETGNPRSSIELKTFYPFTFPLTVGPGGLAVVLTFSAHLDRESRLMVTLEQGSAIIGICLICVAVSIGYRNLNFMTKKFSAAAALAISKILAFFVLCIGVEIHGQAIRLLFIK